MAVLEMLGGKSPGKRFRIEGPRAVLGRHPDCDIVLDAGAVSRQHAQISYVDGQYVVEYLHSRNGTFVNGEQIQSPQKLQDGDRVKICDLSFNFYREQPATGKLTGTGRHGDTAFAGAVLLDDTEQPGSHIMSKLDVRSSSDGFRLMVNPEVKLRALIEITQNLSKAISLDNVLPKLIDSLFKIFVQADRGLIVFKGPEGEVIPKVIRHRRDESEDTMRISRTILKQVMESKQAILSADAASDQRFEMSQSIADFRIRSMMCAPLIDSDGEAFGVIQIDTGDQRSRFQQDDLDVLAGVASLAAFAIDNAQLHERAMRQQQIQRDLELAHRVQRALLPVMPPEVPGYHFFDYYEAANQVGGDFYDYIRLPNGTLAIVLADVSGKGVAAALVMARLSSEVRFCLVSENSPAAAVNRINAGFCQAGWEDRFVTFVLAVLDPIQHKLTIVNAGHMAPYLRSSDGSVRAVSGEEAGLPLGVSADFEYEATTYDLMPGNFLALFTDGISEAMNAQNELYGLNNLERQVRALAADVSALGRHILDDVKRFVGSHPQSDDMCMVCLGRASTRETSDWQDIPRSTAEPKASAKPGKQVAR